MRYWNDESTYILSSFDTWLDITIDIYYLLDNSLVIDDIACSEIWTTGIYKYSFSNSSTVKKEFLWIMKSSLDNHSWKIVLWGIIEERFLDADRTQLDSLENYDDTSLINKIDTLDDKIEIIKNLEESDEEHTQTTIKKKHKTTKEIIFSKNVTWSNLKETISITE